MPYNAQNSFQAPANNSTPPQGSSTGGAVSKLPWFQIIMGVTLAGGVVVGGRAIGKKLGLVKDAAGVKDTTAILNMPQFAETWLADETKKHPAGAKVTKIWESYDKIKPVADNIYNSKGFFKDDKDSFWAMVKLMDSQVALWQVAKVFKQLYNKDMGSFISTLLNTDEQQRFIDMINKLPSGFTS